MKTLLTTIALAFALNAPAQIKTDKVAHFGIGYVTGALTTSATLIYSNGKHEWLKSLSVGIASGVIVGTAKELYDFKDYGRFDWQDLGATVIGAALGSVTIKISINRYEKKHLL